MTSHRIVHHARLNEEVLDQWVEAGWLVPHRESTGQRFSSVDLARAYLIRDLQDLGVNDDGIPIILDLVDQVHGLRFVLRELLSTIKTQQGHGRA
jgi:chaperone modulatory protein CbpM